MWKIRIMAVLFVVLGTLLGGYVYQSEKNESNPFKLGLDLKGGSYLVYRADTSDIIETEVSDSMGALRDTIERRINAFGIAEPNVTTETHSLGVNEAQERLVVELPGVTDIDEAVKLIGQTPVLEFKQEVQDIDEQKASELSLMLGLYETDPNSVDIHLLRELQNEVYENTPLTGKYLEKAQLQFSQAGIQGGGSLQSKPIIALSFNREGSQLFEELTRNNVGKTIAIFLDDIIVSAPRVNQAISGGQAIIEGNFTLNEAKEDVGRLNSGALPVPLIGPIDTKTIGPSLGQDAVDAGVQAGILGLLLVALVLILWYRLPGLIAVIALGVYTAIMLWMFKFIPVTLTSAGIAGFIISIGIAVDANILIFERIKEELAQGKTIYESSRLGFKRAWDSIRDANISSIISAVILFWFGTALIKGFALTFGLGILVSMFSAVTVTRAMLLAFTNKKVKKSSRIMKFLYQSGLTK